MGYEPSGHSYTFELNGFYVKSSDCFGFAGSKLDPEDEFCVNMGNLFKFVQHEISEVRLQFHVID